MKALGDVDAALFAGISSRHSALRTGRSEHAGLAQAKIEDCHPKY